MIRIKITITINEVVDLKLKFKYDLLTKQVYYLIEVIGI